MWKDSEGIWTRRNVPTSIVAREALPNLLGGVGGHLNVACSNGTVDLVFCPYLSWVNCVVTVTGGNASLTSPAVRDFSQRRVLHLSLIYSISETTQKKSVHSFPKLMDGETRVMISEPQRTMEDIPVEPIELPREGESFELDQAVVNGECLTCSCAA